MAQSNSGTEREATPRNHTEASNGPRRMERRGSFTSAANVLGVMALVDGGGVRLVWESPSASDHVVVSRTAENGEQRIIFRGRTTSVRDDSPQSCRMYRYTIVSYDRQGRRSTGVPTSVMTGGCT